MFLFQSDSDLPNILLGITLLIIALISLIHSPENLAMSPLGRLKDLLMGFVFRCTGVGVGDPVARSAHIPIAMELPTTSTSGAISAGTQPRHNVNAVQDTATPSHLNPNPPVFNYTPERISYLNQTITQIMPTDHTSIPLHRAISIVAAHVTLTDITVQSSRINLLVDESAINSVVDAFALALIDHRDHHQRASVNHLQTHIQQLNLNINLPEKTITTSFSTALALKSRALGVLIKSPNKGALSGVHHISMEPTQRTFVGFKSLGQAARGWSWRWRWHWLRLRARLRVGSVDSSTVDHQAYDLERGEALGPTDEELNNWVEEMARVVVQEVRRMCQLMPPEGSREEGARVCEGAGARDGDGWKIKLKD